MHLPVLPRRAVSWAPLLLMRLIGGLIGGFTRTKRAKVLRLFASARTKEPVAEGMVSILEPFIDTLIICTLTGLVILSSGVWKEKFENDFSTFDTEIVMGPVRREKFSPCSTTGSAFGLGAACE